MSDLKEDLLKTRRIANTRIHWERDVERSVKHSRTQESRCGGNLEMSSAVVAD